MRFGPTIIGYARIDKSREHVQAIRRKTIPPYTRLPVEQAPLFPPTDFGEVKGQEHVKRVLGEMFELIR